VPTIFNISTMHLPADTRPAPISLSTAFWYWLKLGFISFGGPAGQIAMMHTELVERRRWISEQRFLHALNYCMLLPGPEATQLAVYIGWLMHKTRGGILAGLLFILPSLLILIGLAWIYMAYGSVPAVSAVLYGIKPAVVAIVLAAAWRIGKRSLKNGALLAIAGCAFIAIAVFQLPFPAIVLAAAGVGAIGGRYWPQYFHIGGKHPSAQASYGLALIDDDTPTPPHATMAQARWLRTGVIGIILALATWMLLAAVFGLDNPLVTMATFFTKAAMLTFGGAYAVLPYVYQGGVDTYHWLTPAQMIDGLALGETTPGPLIMIVAFVGFVGGWTHDLFGGHLLAAGMAGACVAAFFTFLPSFVFILVGGPLVESTRDNLQLTAPLTGISAAVVGVVASLAVFFGQHVFHLSAAPVLWDWTAIGISLFAAIALLRYQLGTIKLLLACAIAGLVLSYLHA
jgi:chromate transporter